MTDKNLRNDTSDAADDDLLNREQEATLNYRDVRSAEKKHSKGRRRGPLPVTGNAYSRGGAAGAVPAGAPPAAQGAGNAGLTPAPTPLSPMAEAAAAGSVGVMAAGGEVHFGNEQLAAAGVDHSEDPWGAYDNPENIPGLTLDEDEERADSARTSMAMRSSGTRGGKKGAGSGMGPMMPMAGAGAGAAGGGAPGGTTLPSATLGGFGGAQNLASAQQALTYQSMSGGASSAAMAGLQSSRATGAMFSPPSSGVLAAGGDVQSSDPAAFAEAMRAAGIDTTQQFIEGPDGNLYPNPYYDGGGAGRSGFGSSLGLGRGADLNGDGYVSNEEMARWNAGQGKVSDGVSNSWSGLSHGQRSHDATHGVPAPDAGPSLQNGGVRQGVERLSRDAYRDAITNHGGSEGTSASSGVKQQVSGLQSTQYSHLSDAPSQPSASSRDFIRNAGGVSKRAGHTNATAKDFSVRSEELRVEAKAWDSIAQEQARLRDRFDRLVGDAATFGVMSRYMQPSYEAMREASVVSTEHRTGINQYTSENMALSAEAYDTTELQNAQLSDREIP
ncbi:hypothetical protein [uncultured Tessaracoccus sp.]|uniref:hypothetical protein n=1 Tax=uncultured Tessaracoccus sp. TaxID=905023 RepID=UPI00262B4B00|nr:hypothetical protein [uncultured Tessaracoccus sp.]